MEQVETVKTSTTPTAAQVFLRGDKTADAKESKPARAKTQTTSGDKMADACQRRYTKYDETRLKESIAKSEKKIANNEDVEVQNVKLVIKKSILSQGLYRK